jgi:hypothetical protein
VIQTRARRIAETWGSNAPSARRWQLCRVTASQPRLPGASTRPISNRPPACRFLCQLRLPHARWRPALLVVCLLLLPQVAAAQPAPLGPTAWPTPAVAEPLKEPVTAFVYGRPAGHARTISLTPLGRDRVLRQSQHVAADAIVPGCAWHGLHATSCTAHARDLRSRLNGSDQLGDHCRVGRG